MNNKQVLNFILTTEQLLCDYGEVTIIDSKQEKKKELRRIFSEAQKMQRDCYDPYLFATRALNNDEVEYTCLVCGKIIGGTNPLHVVNLTEKGLIEGDDALEYAVNKLKKYLEVDPPLSEVEIREALRRDLMEFAKQR